MLASVTGSLLPEPCLPVSSSPEVTQQPWFLGSFFQLFCYVASRGSGADRLRVAGPLSWEENQNRKCPLAHSPARAGGASLSTRHCHKSPRGLGSSGGATGAGDKASLHLASCIPNLRPSSLGLAPEKRPRAIHLGSQHIHRPGEAGHVCGRGRMTLWAET